MKLGRPNHIGILTQQTQFVIASVAKQSRAEPRNTGLLRYARNDDCFRVAL
jgi:hypothetical protein